MKYNLIKSNEDSRDLLYRTIAVRAKLPKTADLSRRMPPVYDQGELGSCAANAGSCYIAYMYGWPFNDYSRLYLYQKARVLEGNLDIDSGVTMRSIPKALQKNGICLEKYFPYVTEKFAVPASAEAEKDAAQRKITAYRRLYALDEIKNCTAVKKLPVLLGMQVYESFESEYTKKTGRMKQPGKDEKLLGGHAVLVYGYDDAKNGGCLLVRNSWGVEWGDKGNFLMPYKYVANHTFDYWALF